MELKTLKDLKTFIQERNQEFVAVPLLKQEVIKWVKDEDKLSPSAKAGFRQFHNITDEDLE